MGEMKIAMDKRAAYALLAVATGVLILIHSLDLWIGMLQYKT